jgi:hypothetical protein
MGYSSGIGIPLFHDKEGNIKRVIAHAIFLWRVLK